MIESIFSGLVSFIEAIIKIREKSKWGPGAPSYKNAMISIFYIPQHQNKVTCLFKILETLNFKPQRFKLNLEESELELTSRMVRETEQSWASILIDPDDIKMGHIAHAFRNFAHRRTDVVAIVAGSKPTSLEILDRYTHMSIPEGEPNRHEVTEALMRGSLHRVRHYKGIARSAVVLFLIAIFCVFLLGSVFGWWFARDRARNALETVRGFDAAEIETFVKDEGVKGNGGETKEVKTKKKDIVVLAASSVEVSENEITEYTSVLNKRTFLFKLHHIDFVDKLVQVKHKWGGICLSDNSNKGESGYVESYRNKAIRLCGITEQNFNDSFKGPLEKRLDEFLGKSTGKREDYLPVVLFIEVKCDSVNTGSDLWNVDKGAPLAFLNETTKKPEKVIIMCFEESQVEFDGETIFTIKRISRASTRRLCGIQ